MCFDRYIFVFPTYYLKTGTQFTKNLINHTIYKCMKIRNISKLHIFVNNEVLYHNDSYNKNNDS